MKFKSIMLSSMRVNLLIFHNSTIDKDIYSKETYAEDVFKYGDEATELGLHKYT